MILDRPFVSEYVDIFYIAALCGRRRVKWVILKYATTHNHPQPPSTTHSHPQPSTTTLNHPQPSTTIHNHPQPPTAIHNHPENHPQPLTTINDHPKITQKARTCHRKLCYCTLDVNTEIDVDLKQVI